MTPATLYITDILRHKRDGLPLTTPEIDHFIRGVTDRTITDAQTSALLMAIFLRGLNPHELAALTSAMRLSGETFDPTPLANTTGVSTPSASEPGASEPSPGLSVPSPFVVPRPFLIDKHSTGGVGDKTSLLIAPILAAAGLAHPTATGAPGLCVPMISGRSLGHTGGTLDKLETIPGFNTQLSLARFTEVLRHCGAALIGQTPTLVPADRILYALRDHTSTVESPFLITASIMSKKLAEALDALVLDVKTGSGAFMKSYEESRHLATLMVQTGTLAGTRTVALLTSMDQPLGRFAGNWLEVRECVDILRAGPDPSDRHPLSADLVELTNILSGWMLHLAGQAVSPAAGAILSNEILKSGAAYQAWLGIVRAQGGDPAIFDSQPPDARPPSHSAHPAENGAPTPALQTRPPAQDGRPAPGVFSRTVTAETSGYLASMDCTEVGWAVQRLGAGRTRPGDPVSAHAGIEMHIKLGHKVEPGQPLITLYAEEESLLHEPHAMLRATLQITPTPPTLQPLIHEVIA